MIRSRHLFVPALLCLFTSAACRSSDDFFAPRVEASQERLIELESIDEELNRAEWDIDEGNTLLALERLQRVREIDGLDAEARNRSELLLERASVGRLNQLIQTRASADDLEELFEEDVPKRVRVTAGVVAARRLLEDNEPLEAYSMIRRVDEEFTSHHERAAAGDILAEAGFSLAESTEKHLLFFSVRARAPEVLEYLVLNYPSNRNGEQAYLTLAELYEDDREYELALERYEDLLLYYRDSAYGAYAEARIPELRLRLIVGPEYDRAQIERAELELLNWLERHSDNELTSYVLETLAESRRLKMDSDLSIAAFYRRVDNRFGARLHASRALDLAVLTQDAERIQRANQILDDVLPAEPEIDENNS